MTSYSLVAMVVVISLVTADPKPLSKSLRSCKLNVTLLDLQGRDYSVRDLCDAKVNKVKVGLRCVSGSRRGSHSWLNPCRKATPPVLLHCDPTVKTGRQMSLLLWLQKGDNTVVDTVLHPLHPSSPGPRVLPLTGRLSQTRFTVAVSQRCVTVTERDSNLQPSTQNRASSPPGPIVNTLHQTPKSVSLTETVLYSPPEHDDTHDQMSTEGRDKNDFENDENDLQQNGNFVVVGRDTKMSKLVDENADTFENDDGSSYTPTLTNSGGGDSTSVSDISTDGSGSPPTSSATRSSHGTPASTGQSVASPTTSTTSSTSSPTPASAGINNTSDELWSVSADNGGDHSSTDHTDGSDGQNTQLPISSTAAQPAGTGQVTSGAAETSSDTTVYNITVRVSSDVSVHSVTMKDSVTTDTSVKTDASVTKDDSVKTDTSVAKDDSITTNNPVTTNTPATTDSVTTSFATTTTLRSSSSSDSGSQQTTQGGSSETKAITTPRSGASTEASVQTQAGPGGLAIPGDTTLETATAGNSSGLAHNPASSSSGQDDTFWPIVAALVIGIPSIIVIGIAIIVIHRRRRVAAPTGRLRVASLYS